MRILAHAHALAERIEAMRRLSSAWSLLSSRWPVVTILVAVAFVVAGCYYHNF
jgi:hypothetical protein